jgi:signal transduction histidine kinase
MLERAVEALRQDEQQALERFTGGAEGFKEKDLYVFCVGQDGQFTAHGANLQLVGQDATGVTDRAGNPLGQRILETAEEGEFNEVDYMWPRPGEQEPIPKTAYVTKVEDQICGVGYYEQP